MSDSDLVTLETKPCSALIGAAGDVKARQVQEAFQRDGLAVVRKEQRHMVQAIATRYRGPSNVRGARIIATAESGRIIVNYDHRLNVQENHRAAAQRLADKFEWCQRGEFLLGGAVAGSGYAFIIVVPAD